MGKSPTEFFDVEGVPVRVSGIDAEALDSDPPRVFPYHSVLRNGSKVSEAEFWAWVSVERKSGAARSDSNAAS